MNSPPMELEIWKGDWGIPSIDVHCLEILTYAKFSGVPLKVQVSSPLFAPGRELPVFRHGKQVVITKNADIVDYFKKKNFGADFGLKPKELADAEAYKSLVREKLFPALQFIWYVNEKNYENLTRPWFGKALRFPIGLYFSYKRHEKAVDLMEVSFADNIEKSEIETQVLTDAEKCITALSTILGDKDHFFASGPSSLDATVYAYIATLLKPPFPVTTLQNHIKSCPNLVRFVTRVSNAYFLDTVKEYNKKKTEEDEKAKKESDNEFPHKRRKQLFAALVAAVAMFMYAVATGLVDVSIAEDNTTDSEDDMKIMEDSRSK